MPPLRGLLVDVGGTLVPSAFAISEEAFVSLCVERLTEAFGTELPWFRAVAGHTFANSGVDPETLRQDVVGEVRRLLATLGVRLEPRALSTITRACAVPMPQLVPLSPGAEDAMREARDLGLRLAICSNTFWRDDAAVAEDWRAFGLDDCFDAYVTSPSTGYVKPHRAIFERALRAIDVLPEEAAIVGDRLNEDMAGGRAAGLRTIWLRPADSPVPVGPPPDATLDAWIGLRSVLEAWVQPAAPSSGSGVQATSGR